VYVRDPAIKKWVYGMDAASWERRGRQLVFGDDADAIKAKEKDIKDNLPWRGGGTLRVGFGPVPPSKRPVDPTIHRDPELDALMERRKETPGWFARRAEPYKEFFNRAREFMAVTPPDLKKWPKVAVERRKAMQDREDAMEKAQEDAAQILQPFGHRRLSDPPSDAEKVAGKIAILEDMVRRSQEPVGTSKQIERARKRLQTAGDAVEAAQEGPRRELRTAIKRFRRARLMLEAFEKRQPQPLNRSTDELKADLKELMDREGDHPDVQEFLRRDTDMHRWYLQQDIARGHLPAELLAREGRYFPHEVENFSDMLGKNLGALPRAAREPFRAWTKKAIGSEKSINFAYREAIERDFFRRRVAWSIEDRAAATLPVYDKLPELRANPEKWAEHFTDSSGRVLTENELPDGEVRNIDGQRYQVFRWRRFYYDGWTPPSDEAAAAADFILRQDAPIYLIPEETVKYYERDAYNANIRKMIRFNRQYPSWWKKTMVAAGGLGTRAANTFGDFVQYYFQDATGLYYALKFPTLNHVLFRSLERMTPYEREIKRIMDEQRAGSGSTWYGKEGRELAAKLRNMTPTERARFWANPLNWPEALNKMANTMELWPRAALTMRNYDKIMRGEELHSKVFPIEGLEPEDQLGVIVRNTFVDPQGVSEGYQQVLRRWYLPFITWYHRTMEYQARYMTKHPIEALLKHGIPAAAMFYWNNILHRDTERNVSSWTKMFLWHITLPYGKDPDQHISIVFPTGADLFFNIVQIPQMEEAIARWKNRESDKLAYLNWSDAAATAIHIGETFFKDILDLSPIGQAFEGVVTNKDPRTGEPIVPEKLMADPKRRVWAQAQYLASKAMPALDRILHFTDRAIRQDPTWLDRVIGSGGGPWRKRIQDFFAEWFNPMRAMVFQTDSKESKAIAREAHQVLGEQQVQTYDLNQALHDILNGGTGDALEAWLKNNEDSNLTPGKAFTLSDQHDELLRELKAAKDDKEREQIREDLDDLEEYMRYLKFKGLPPSVKSETLRRVLGREAGEKVPEHAPGIFGEGEPR